MVENCLKIIYVNGITFWGLSNGVIQLDTISNKPSSHNMVVCSYKNNFFAHVCMCALSWGCNMHKGYN